jgi:hypothetical protein
LILLLPTGGFSRMVCQEWASPVWYYNSGAMTHLFHVRVNTK